MKIYDISIPIQPNMPIWPGDPPVKLERFSDIEKGSDENITKLQMCVHTGTHIDSPNHFFLEGNTVDHLSFNAFIGEVWVMEISPEVDVISDKVLANHSKTEWLKETKRVLFKTRNSKLWDTPSHNFQKDYVGLDTSGAEFLAKLNFALIGMDYLSIASYGNTRQPHQILLSQNIVLLEGINLSDVPQGTYQLFCAPLLIEGCEGAPARALLMK